MAKLSIKQNKRQNKKIKKKKPSPMRRLVHFYEKISRPAIRAAGAFLVLAIVVLTLYQPFASLLHHKQLDTETTLFSTIERKVETSAVAIRCEQALPAAVSGTAVPMVKNGTKVMVGETVASVFTSEEQAQKTMDYHLLQDRIAYYEEIEALSGGSVFLDAGIYDNAIASSLINVQRALNRGALTAVPDLVDQMTLDVSKKQIAVNGKIDVSAKLAQLRSQAQAYEGFDAAAYSIKTEVSGYYFDSSRITHYDLPFAEVPKMTVQQVDTLLGSTPDEETAQRAADGSCGKIVSQFIWYLVFRVSTEDASLINVGRRMRVAIDGVGADSLRMTVRAVNVDEENGGAAVVLSSTEMNAEIAALGKMRISYAAEEYSGYLINKNAIQIRNNQLGVFVQIGNTAKFRHIRIVYEDEAIALVDTDADGDRDYLKLYDAVVKEGADLKDDQLIS